MKNSITKQLKKLTLALSLGTAFVAATEAQAADFKLEVQVRGYSGCVLVVDGSNTGGRVQWSSSRGYSITDRVSRSESACLTIVPTPSPEYLYQGGFVAASRCKTHACLAIARSPFRRIPRRITCICGLRRTEGISRGPCPSAPAKSRAKVRQSGRGARELSRAPSPTAADDRCLAPSTTNASEGPP